MNRAAKSRFRGNRVIVHVDGGPCWLSPLQFSIKKMVMASLFQLYFRS